MIDALTRLDLDSYTRFLYGWVALGILSALVIHFSGLLPLSSRYENQHRVIFGSIDKKLGWIIMETPILVAVLYFYLVGDNAFGVATVIVGAFVLHYVHRALIYPHRIKVRGKTMPVYTVVASMLFYTVNGYLIGHYFGSLRAYSIEWLIDPRFLAGAALFVSGFVINVTSDNILIRLRAPRETGYKIPREGLFRLVSCPNFFGEMVEWLGFAVMSWSLPGVVYALWVSLTLFATALGTHRWYLEHFGGDYPPDRKAVLPFLI
jgi:3-oxo-5-alpha-steroid 4-dehydrogenase 1